METNHVLVTGLILLLAAVSAATAADKESTTNHTQYQVKDQATTTIPLNTDAAVHSALPQAARGIDLQRNKAIPGGLQNPAAERLGQVGRAAAMANQARGLREARQAIQGMMNTRDLKNLGGLDNLDGPLGGSQSNTPLDRLGTKQPGGGMPDYMTKSPFGNSAFGMPKPTDPDAPRGNRSSPYAGGSLMPPSPGDVAGPGGIGLVSQGRVGVIRNGAAVYTDRRQNADGSHTQTATRYDANTGELLSFYSQTYNADGSMRSTHTIIAQDNGGFFSDPTVWEQKVEYKHEEGVIMGDPEMSTTQERELGSEAGDPSFKDPSTVEEDIATLPTTDPYGPGSGGGYCPPYLAGCQWEADAARRSRQSPNRVNPGTADNLARPQAPRLAVDTQGLVTNPDPTGNAGGGFNPPAGWRTGENGTPGGPPGSPGGMPPRPGSEP